MKWKQKAAQAIQDARHAAAQQGLDPAATLACVDAACPFGPREHHPYKMWLQERRRLCSDLPGVKPLGCRRPSYEDALRAWNAGEPLKGA